MQRATAGKVLLRAVIVAVVAAWGAVAGPVVTGSQVRAFLGGQTGKLVYTHLDDDATPNKHGRSLYYLDFSDDTLVERLVVDYHSESTEPRNALISPDGQWVVYNTLDMDHLSDGVSLYAARLQQNAPTPVGLGRGALPVWWTKPGTEEQYIIYVDKDLDNGGWVGSYNGGFPPQNAATYCLRIDATTRAPIGSATQLMRFQANGGRSMNGAWMFTAGGIPGTFHIDPQATENTPIYDTLDISADHWSDADSLDGCNPSISPHWPEADIRVMYLDKPHTGYHICDVRGENRIHREWNDQENPYLDELQWSTHTDFAACKASLNDVLAPFDLYLFRTTDGAKLKIVEGNNSFPHLWVAGSNAIRDSRRAPPGRGAMGMVYSNGLVRVTGGTTEGSITVSNVQGRVVAGPAAAGGSGLTVRLAPGTYVASVVDRAGTEILRSRMLVR